MMNNSSKIMFLSTLMIGTLITISSNSWLGAWMGLEINLLSFIPLMSDNNLMSTESSLKYFLTQALASVILLFAVILFLLKNNMNIENEFNYFSFIIISSLLLKSGAAPFHFWFPMVMEGMSWINTLILMTWQKIAPLMLISYMMIKPIMIVSIILSSIIGAMGGLNQTSLRKLMAFSSINHLGWLLTAMYSSENLWMIYFLIYTILSFNMVFMFNIFKLFHINQLFSLFFNSKTFKFIVLMNLLSLGGLPPFLGFIPKWLVIQSLTFNSHYFLIGILIMTTLITLYFYLRISYSAFLLNYHETNWLMSMWYNKITMNIFLMFAFISTNGLFLISFIYLFI